MDPTNWSTIGQIALYLGAGGLAIILNGLKEKAKDWYHQRRLHPLARSVLANKKVNNLLVDLRAKTDADRVSVFLFHNGQIFSNKNPLWRVSCTQECCRAGVSHEIDNLQSILASFFWDGISPFYGETNPGIRLYDEKAKLKVYIIDVLNLNDGYYKRSLLARGVSINIVSPIIDSLQKEIVGYLSLNYSIPENEIKNLDEVVKQSGLVSGLVDFELFQ